MIGIRHAPSRATLRAALALATLFAVGPALAQEVSPTAPAASPTTPAAATPPAVAPSVATPPTVATDAAPASPAPAPSPVPAPEGSSTVAPSVPTPSVVAPPTVAPSANVPDMAPAAPAPATAPEGSSAAAPSQGSPPSAADLVTAPTGVPSATLPHDLSPWGMFMAADWVVKSVMIGLAFASLVTWTIWLAKAFELALARSKAKRAVRRLEDAASLADVATSTRGANWPKRGPVAALVAAAEGEIARSGDMAIDGVKERTQVALQRIEARAGRSMARGTGLLATIGSTAPFVGLFGTVWGIMNSFIGISQANTTNLAVVAPGIAEALLATAIGLVAAIPAVIIYNAFARSIAGYRAVLADASAEVLRHLSRDLDRRQHAVIAASGRLRAAE